MGIAHIADLEDLPVAIRAGCERRALRFGRALLIGGGAGPTALPAYFSNMGVLVAGAAAAAGGE